MKYITAQKIEWLVLIAVFLMAGIIGHDPWKQDETYSFGIIYHFYVSHSWLIPMNAGTPFMEKPPLYYWTAVIFCKLLGGILQLHDAARITSVFYMALATGFMWKTSQVLFEKYEERNSLSLISLALFLGSLGLVRHSHDMFTDVALLAGTVITLYGMAVLIAQQRWKHAGVWIGLGVGIAFLSKGFLIPAILGLSGIILWIILPLLHTRKTAGAFLLAVLIASPFLCIWPFLLHETSPALFMEWFWNNNIGRFLGFSVPRLGADNKPYFMLYTILWFAFPAFSLACVTLICERKSWRNPGYILPAIISLIGFVMLMVSASARALYLLPLVPFFALLGAKTLATIPECFLKNWNYTVRIVFTAALIIVWVIWVEMLYPEYSHFFPLSGLLGKWLTIGFKPEYFYIFNILLAIAISALWLFSLRLPSYLALNTSYIWLAGIAMMFSTTHTLLLPWIDETKSYRPILMQMDEFIHHSPYRGSCISSYNLGESIAPMFEYFNAGDKKEPVNTVDKASCTLLVTSTEKNTNLGIEADWKLLWKASRALDAKNEELRLYGRKNVSRGTF
jgi:4-amino-4-deoxy-L-arabinose transferase-like glycosyltransferase